MADKKDVISYGDYQKLSEEEKQNYETKWNSDGKSGIATRKGAKLPEVKSTIPVTEMKVSEPGKTKTEAADKANQMSDSTIEEEEEAAIVAAAKAKEDYNQAMQLLDEITSYLDKKMVKGENIKERFTPDNLVRAFKGTNDLFFGNEGNGKGKFETYRDQVANLAKEKGIDIGDISKDLTGKKTLKAIEIIRNDMEARVQETQNAKQKARKVAKSARNRLTEGTSKKQKAQDNYTKAGEEAKKKAAADAEAKRKAEEAAKEQEAETETEKDETKDPLEKAEELEQPRAPTDIKKFSNDLNRFVIQAYLNGDFGKKSNPNSIAAMGFFILDKLGAALVNASEVARGMSPSAKSQWSDVLDKQTELLGKRITAEWFLDLSKEQQEALVRSGVISGTTAQTIYETTDPNAVDRAEQKDVLEISKLSQEQKGVAQSNVNALLARKSELQILINQLRSDQGWEAYAQAMNAIVGTAKGLSSLGITDDSSSSSNKGFSDTLSVDVSTGKVTSAFVSGKVSNNSTWNNSSAESLSKSNSLNQDALALSKFKSGEAYAKATREAKKEANEQLIKRLEGQIEIIDKCIDSWGKDLGL